MKFVDYPILFRTCVKLRRRPEKFCIYYQGRHLSADFYDKQKHGYMRQKIDEIIHWYDEFTGMDEVRSAQRRVLEDEENFRKSQDERRKVLNDLKDVQRKLKDISTELDNTPKDDDRYVSLVTQEHKLLKEEKLISERFSMAERMERDHFSALSSSVKLSHEKERAQSERTKYWSIIASAVGTVIGILGTSINNYFKMNEIKELIQKNANTELLDNINRYLEANETLLSDIRKNPKVFVNSNAVKIEDLFSNIDNKLNKIEYGLKEIQIKTENKSSNVDTMGEDSIVETVTVEDLSKKMTKEYVQIKILLFTVAVLSIIIPVIGKNM